jgi:NADH dehydrogenase [ubiquinone] 1 alpha subcomplex assembly factor 6
MSGLVAARRHCIELVRKADYESYLCALLLPSASSRDAAFAIRALNVETALVKSVVSKPELGMIRLAWWQQQIDDSYSAAKKARRGEQSKRDAASNEADAADPAHPVVCALRSVILESSLTKGWFTRFIEARMRQIQQQQPATVDEIEQSAEEIHASLLYLLLDSVGVKSVEADHIASHIGKAAGIVTALRALPFNTAQGDVQLPQDLMAKHALSKEQLVRSFAAPIAPDVQKRLADCVFDLAVVAKNHLDHARDLTVDHPAPAGADRVFFAAIPLVLYLERLERANFNCLVPDLHQRPFALYSRLAKASWFDKKF